METVLDRLSQHEILVSQKKVQMFLTKVEFCGHILQHGKRSPAPGKLLALQKWELPSVVTQLRAFLGCCNYYNGYVKNYASLAMLLYKKLQLNKEDGKKGSNSNLNGKL